MGHYHYEPGEDDKLISELVIPYTEQSYKAMLAEVNKYFIGEYKKKYRYLRYLVCFSFLIMVADVLLIKITGNKFIVRDNFPAGNYIVMAALGIFFFAGLFLAGIRGSIYFALKSHRKALKSGKITPENPAIYRFYDTGITFNEPHQCASLYWQAFHLISAENGYLLLSLCPENTEKGKETAGLTEVIIPVKTLMHINDIIAVLSDDAYRSDFYFHDYRK